MNAFAIFILECGASIVLSIITIMLIKPLLLNVLSETCGTTQRAEFWVMFTQLMLVISPLLLVIFFTHISDYPDVSAVLVFKDTLFRALLGLFIGLLIVGQVIRKSIIHINQENPNPAVFPAQEQ